MSVVTGSGDELWEFDERLMIWDEVNSRKEIGCKVNIYGKQL